MGKKMFGEYMIIDYFHKNSKSQQKPVYTISSWNNTSIFNFSIFSSGEVNLFCAFSHLGQY